MFSKKQLMKVARFVNCSSVFLLIVWQRIFPFPWSTAACSAGAGAGRIVLLCLGFPQRASAVGRAGNGAETRPQSSDWVWCVAEMGSHWDWQGIWDFCMV